MTMTTKRLPLGDPGFAEIIDQNLLYADKTRYIHELLTGGKQYFLSRPRRFGKTLLLRAIRELFSGDSSRFRGLWIGGPESGYDFPRHPVLSLSLSTGAESPEILKENLFTDLKDIADKAGLGLRGASPDAWFGNLIQDLGEKTDSRVVVLIDEYDAPVTRNMHNPKVAQANARVLHDFFATLKKRPVAKQIRLTVVTGITRYALTSMDSGPNHLNDISLDPRFAGVCGFTLDEFGPLFEDRLPATLASLKEAGKMKDSATEEDLRAEILKWYDGYNWGGTTRVLNPYSILHFFGYNSFSRHWILSGRPAHLTALIQADPYAFSRSELKSHCTSTEVRKTELTRLAAVPCLFHSGYLTLDKVEVVLVENPLTKKMEPEDSYSFRLPNYEVAGVYDLDCFTALFGEKVVKELPAKKETLEKAFLARDAKTVGDVLRGFLAKLTYHQRPDDEKTFHGYVQLILSALDFKVQSELAGAVGRLDLTVELPGRVHLIIEMKYCPGGGELSKEEEAQALAAAMIATLNEDVVYGILAGASIDELDPVEALEIISTTSDQENKNKLLARLAMKSLTKERFNQVLAGSAAVHLSPGIINAALRKAAARKPDPLDDKAIDGVLTKATDQALRDIIARDYHDIIDDDAVEIIDLGLAVYGHGNRVKAVFGPAGESDPAPPGT